MVVLYDGALSEVPLFLVVSIYGTDVELFYPGNFCEGNS